MDDMEDNNIDIASDSLLSRLVREAARDTIAENGSGMPWADFMDETTYQVAEELGFLGYSFPESQWPQVEELVSSQGSRLLAEPDAERTDEYHGVRR